MLLEQLARIDLNLLIILQVLLEERNGSRAARRLHLSQSAVSKALGRLRETFDDPLFVRSAYGMDPTPRALDLQQQLQHFHGGRDEEDAHAFDLRFRRLFGRAAVRGEAERA